MPQIASAGSLSISYPSCSRTPPWRRQHALEDAALWMPLCASRTVEVVSAGHPSSSTQHRQRVWSGAMRRRLGGLRLIVVVKRHLPGISVIWVNRGNSSCRKRGILTAIRHTEGRIFTHNGSYVDNRPSTPYHPQDTVASGEGERYAESTNHPSGPRLPAAPSVALFESAEPSVGRDLSGPSACPPLGVVDAGRRPPRPHMCGGADARGPAGHPLSGPHADPPWR
jgi:hypothetical protein